MLPNRVADGGGSRAGHRSVPVDQHGRVRIPGGGCGKSRARSGGCALERGGWLGTGSDVRAVRSPDVRRFLEGIGGLRALTARARGTYVVHRATGYNRRRMQVLQAGTHKMLYLE